MSVLGWLNRLGPTPAEIRAEVWLLGVRHQGEPLEGAMSELRAGGITVERTVLLKACVAQLRRH